MWVSRVDAFLFIRNKLVTVAGHILSQLGSAACKPCSPKLTVLAWYLDRLRKPNHTRCVTLNRHMADENNHVYANCGFGRYLYFELPPPPGRY
jgi:hypothetical protein